VSTHVVERGDTWFDIARSVGVTTRSLLSINDADEARILRPDDVICLPSSASARSSARGAPAARGSRDATNLYTVEAGDTWFDIARRVGVGMRALMSANDADDSRIIHPGESLTLPPGAAAPAKSGAAVSARGTSSSASTSASTYTVATGDSWFGISRRVQTTLQALYAANDASEQRQLHPGDVVRLPEGARAPASTGSAASSSGGSASVSLQALPMHGPCWYADSWHAPRGGGRLHIGVDIFARTGNYVYAVVDGTLTNRVWDRPGRRAGNAWWLTAADGSGTYFFYAHLADFAPGLQVGSKVKAGEIIGFMGNTGNSAFPHLHLEIHPNGGPAVNPYPIVKQHGGCKTGEGYRQPNGWVPTVSGYRG
jgi:murein DD-endopeptidase MepM/ murein hydrolase activator NlpD